ncbi:MAG TPA: ATP-binding protein, partial [Caulobacteraceae bacterium]
TRAFLETVIDNIPSGLTVKRAVDRRLLLANQAVARIFGFERAEDNLGRTNEEVFDAEIAARFTEREHEMIRTGGNRFYEAEPVETRRGVRYLNQLKVLIPNAEAGDYILSISDDVTEQKITQDALKEALARAEAASVAKSEFLANMSHEIRTPLNGVLGLADALARMDLSAPQREIVQMIVGSGKALTAILSDVLDLAKAEAGQLELAGESFSLRETIGSAAFLFETVARDKGVGFRVEFDPDAPDRLQGDPLRIRQVVSNLISNAVKFTSHGEVRINVAAKADARGGVRLSVKVKDTGPGFSEEVRAKLFSRFEQGDGSITRRYGGTGLGLSIANALAQMMGGQIDCRARLGEGAVFIFRARLELSSAASVETAPAMGAGRANLGRRPRVLLAEDHEVNQKVVQLMLADAAELVIVADGQEAVEQALGPLRFDIVLMDTQMPVMDGLTATRRIREQELRLGLSRTPIISLTANAMAHQVQAAMDAGADRHLAKPITAEALYGAIEKTLFPATAGAANGATEAA